MQAIPLERTLVVCMLLDNSQIADIGEILDVNELRDDRCRAIYQTMLELDNLFQGHAPVDAASVVASLKDRGLFEIAGGYAFLQRILTDEAAGDGSLALQYAKSLLVAYGHPVERDEETTAPDYAGYLASTEWKVKAEFVKRGAGNRCQVCNAGGITLDAHHRTYERLGHESPQDLIVLCRSCHSLFHGNGKLAR